MLVEVRVEVADPGLRRLVPDDAALEQVATGFGFTEGPVWRGDHLLFVDIRSSRIIRYAPRPEGPEVTTFRHPSGTANGLTVDRTGRLLACEMGAEARRVSRTGPDGRVEAIAEQWEGKRLNSPNDIVSRPDGSVYFTDPTFGLPNRTEGKELDFAGVWRIAPDGTLAPVARDFDLPNGLAFSPDGRTLYVDDTGRRKLYAYGVRPDGSLDEGRLFYDLASPDPGAPDGMKVDREGNLYCTGPGGVWVFRPDGTFLGRLVLPEIPANLGWGGEGWNTLYLTARTSLYALALPVGGIPVG
jgi:gluconolactonase